MAIESCSSFLQRSGSATGAATPALFTNFLIKFGVKRASSSLRKVFDLTCKEVSNEKMLSTRRCSGAQFHLF